ncbi:ExbD/TolR family protein [Pelosinus baikalensis]|uniref:Biopolymer transporter ExbD n=1 Tax=Pelosinus baikalensis TaxID=2892015 RepID=A0ABS8HS35_9FIRM|nr:biopolymer transporter ExbD [Pelosinus baikalensis]MCC5465993.1 biopolymer transporter ExbD [Pelosinus baikalensis]
MKLRSLRIEKQPELMIIPMIDIIFFLLVFFMMSTLYMVEQHTIPINLPQVAAVQQELSQNINITILQNGNIMFDQEEIPFSLLQKRISIGLAKQPENIFVVRADKQAEYGQVVAVLDELKMSGAHRVAVATDRKGR